MWGAVADEPWLVISQKFLNGYKTMPTYLFAGTSPVISPNVGMVNLEFTRT